MTKFICPLCDKDLGPSMDVLNDPEGVWEMHMRVHTRTVEGDIWMYLLKHREELPAELQQLESKRVKTIRDLIIRKTNLRMIIDDGSL